MRNLGEKLGWKVGMTALVRNRPVGLTAFPDFPLPASDAAPDLIVAFLSRTEQVAPVLAEILPHYERGNRLWLCYPKKTGSIKTDISRDHGWDALAPHDLLGVQQIALDDTWSALRFRYRDEIKTLTRKFA